MTKKKVMNTDYEVMIYKNKFKKTSINRLLSELGLKNQF